MTDRMNADTQNVSGAIKENAGRATGSDDLRARGEAEREMGNENYERATDNNYNINDNNYDNSYNDNDDNNYDNNYDNYDIRGNRGNRGNVGNVGNVGNAGNAGNVGNIDDGYDGNRTQGQYGTVYGPQSGSERNPSKVLGHIHATKGAIKESLGSALNSSSLERAGAGERAAGRDEIDVSKNRPSAVRRAKGDVKENAGYVTGNPRMEHQGRRENIQGQGQDQYYP